MKSKVKIDKKLCLGEFVRTAYGFVLSYKFEGDDCRLLYDGKTLTHEKGGEIPVKIDFCESERTECRIGEGTLLGTVEVATRSLAVNERGGGIEVSVDYLLGEDEMRIDISVYPEGKID